MCGLVLDSRPAFLAYLQERLICLCLDRLGYDPVLASQARVACRPLARITGLDLASPRTAAIGSSPGPSMYDTASLGNQAQTAMSRLYFLTAASIRRHKELLAAASPSPAPPATGNNASSSSSSAAVENTSEAKGGAKEGGADLSANILRSQASFTVPTPPPTPASQSTTAAALAGSIASVTIAAVCDRVNLFDRVYLAGVGGAGEGTAQDRGGYVSVGTAFDLSPQVLHHLLSLQLLDCVAVETASHALAAESLAYAAAERGGEEGSQSSYAEAVDGSILFSARQYGEARRRGLLPSSDDQDADAAGDLRGAPLNILEAVRISQGLFHGHEEVLNLGANPEQLFVWTTARFVKECQAVLLPLVCLCVDISHTVDRLLRSFRFRAALCIVVLAFTLKPLWTSQSLLVLAFWKLMYTVQLRRMAAAGDRRGLLGGSQRHPASLVEVRPAVLDDQVSASLCTATAAMLTVTGLLRILAQPFVAASSTSFSTGDYAPAGDYAPPPMRPKGSHVGRAAAFAMACGWTLIASIATLLCFVLPPIVTLALALVALTATTSLGKLGRRGGAQRQGSGWEDTYVRQWHRLVLDRLPQLGREREMSYF